MPQQEPPVTRVARRVRAQAGSNTALAVTGGAGAVVFALLLFVSGQVYDAVAQSDGISGLDQPTLALALSLRTTAAAQWVTGFTNLGQTVPMVLAATVLTVAMYLRWRRRSIFTLVGVAAAGSVLFTAVGKALVGRSRPPRELAVPPYEYAPSFPSGHTLNSTVIAGVLAYVAVWLARTVWVRILSPLLAVVWAGCMGLSRIYLGHHWLTDVMFAWFFGLAWLALVFTVHRVLVHLDRRAGRPVPPAPGEG